MEAQVTEYGLDENGGLVFHTGCRQSWDRAWETGFVFCLGAGHMEAQGRKKRNRESLCLSLLRLEYHLANSDK